MSVINDSFQNLQFNDDERAFLRALAEQTQAFDFLIILFGFAGVATQPMTPADLEQALVVQHITINAPTWLDAVKGAKNIVAGTAAESVQFFILGKFSGMFGKKPQGQNMAFFKDLAQQYVDMLSP